MMLLPEALTSQRDQLDRRHLRNLALNRAWAWVGIDRNLGPCRFSLAGVGANQIAMRLGMFRSARERQGVVGASPTRGAIRIDAEPCAAVRKGETCAAAEWRSGPTGQNEQISAILLKYLRESC